MSNDEPISEHGPQRDDAPGGLSGELLSSGPGSLGGSSGELLSSGPGSLGGSSADMLSSGPIERPRRNLAAILVSLVAVLAVIGGGVAYVGYHKLASSGAQPDQWAPASSIAYVKIDLDPAAAEKIGALRFEQKFPDAPHVTSADQLKDALLTAAFDRPSGSNPIDYATDIKPWLGDRVAVALYPDSSGNAQPVGILQVKDATKAQAGLTKLIHTAAGEAPASTPGFEIEGDYAVVGPSQAAVAAAVAAARTSNITASNSYASDVATLGGDRIMTAWADLGALAKYASKSGALGLSGNSALGNLSSLGGGTVLGGLGSLSQLSGAQGLTSSALKGRLVLGLELQAGYASISGRLIGADVTGAQNGDAGTLLGQLPAGSVAGVAASGLGAIISKELTTLESGPLQAVGVKSEMNALGARLGISLPGDAINLLGSDVAAGLDSIPAAHGKAKFTAITEPTDVAQGLKTAQALAGLMTASGTPATATASGSKVTLTNDAAATGALGDEPGFKAAMSGMPDQVVAAAYVNLAGIWPTLGSKVPSDITHLTGVGTYEALDGSSITFTVRVTVN